MHPPRLVAIAAHSVRASLWAGMTLVEISDAGGDAEQVRALLRKGHARFDPPLPAEAVARSMRRHQPRERDCMSCGRPFLSEGPHNRMCGKCRDEY